MKIFLSFFVTLGIFASCLSKPKYPPGGYDYPDEQKAVIDTNNYFFPIRDIISTSDSFNYVYYGRYWHQAYSEPNLSIKPFREDIFRLTFQSAFHDAAIITLLKNKITSKQLIKGNPYPEVDSSKFTPLEKHLYELLYWNFPIQNLTGERRRRLDSIARVYPQLLDRDYYRQLLDKSLVPNKDTLAFTSKEIAISASKYYSLLRHINECGYWHMSYETNCQGYFIADGFSVLLEANTRDKYNIVTRFGCPSDDPKFIEVCQEILDAANLDRAINILPGNTSR